MKKHLVFAILGFFCGLTGKGQSNSENVSFMHGSCTFKGTLTKPSGSGPFQTIVLVPGSGQNDRNGTIAMQGGNVQCLYPDLEGETLRIYKDLAEYLTDSGFAVLRYDELTVSCPNFGGPFTYDQLWLPARSALDYLKTRSDVDTSNLILMGHSEGAALIPYIAFGRTDIKALVSLAGARTPFDSLLAYQIVEITRICNGNMANAQLQAQQVLGYFNNIRNGNYNANTPPFGGVAAAEWEKYLQVNDSVGILYEESSLPSLFVGLGNDINVPPTELTRFQNTLTGPFDFYSMPGLIHYMTTDSTPAVSRQLADTIVYWLKSYDQGLADNNKEVSGREIRCYPNPFDESLTIQIDQSTDADGRIELFDLKGNLVMKQVVAFATGKMTVRTPNLKPGLYILRVTSDGTNYYSKLLKEE